MRIVSLVSVALLPLFLFGRPSLATAASLDNAIPSEESDSLKMYYLHPIVISATRTEIERSLSAPSISVVPRQEIEQGREKSILSLISQRVPGVFVQERGIYGFGVNTAAGQISIRGVGGNPNTQVLVLIDGKPQFMGLMGHPLPDSYLTSAAERIEVVRGPASVLYGTNAMAGVINVITKKPTLEGMTGDGSFNYGSYNTQQYNLNLSYVSDGWNVITSGSHEATDGHRPQSSFDILSGYAKAHSKISENVTLTLDGSYSKYKTYDPGPTSAPKIDNWVDIARGYSGFSLDNKFSAIEGSTKFVYNFGRHNIYDGFASDDFSANISSCQTIKPIEAAVVTFGGEYTAYGGDARNTKSLIDFGTFRENELGVYTHAQYTLDQMFVFNGGLRYEYSNLFGGTIIPQAGIVIRTQQSTAFRASIAKGFRSPTIRELYLFPAPTPTLKPEYLWNYEVGVSHTFDNVLVAELVGYETDGSSLIRTEGMYPNLKLSNSGSFVHRGIELSCLLLVETNGRIEANYSYCNSGDETRSIPRNKFFISGTYSLELITFSCSGQYINGIYGSDFSMNRLPDYTLVSIKAELHPLAQVGVTLAVENVLNQEYQTMLGYPMPGRTFFIGARYHF